MYLQVAYSAASSLWLVLPSLLTHAHLWVRKAVLRLLSLGLSDSTLGEGPLLIRLRARQGGLFRTLH